MIRRGLIAASFAAAGLVAMPAFASAQEVEPILDKAVYDDATTYSCRTPVINIRPGQNLNNFGQHSDVPQRGESPGLRPGRRKRLLLERRRATSPVSSRAWSSSPRRWNGHAKRLRPPPSPRRLDQGRQAHLRLRRGEDRGQASPGLRHQGRRKPVLGPQRHDPQPHGRQRAPASTSPGKSTGCRKAAPTARRWTRRSSSGST